MTLSPLGICVREFILACRSVGKPVRVHSRLPLRRQTRPSSFSLAAPSAHRFFLEKSLADVSARPSEPFSFLADASATMSQRPFALADASAPDFLSSFAFADPSANQLSLCFSFADPSACTFLQFFPFADAPRR